MNRENLISSHWEFIMPDTDKTASGRKPATPFQLRVRREAKQKAETAGLDWKAMSKEDRQKIRQEVREALKAARPNKQAKKAKA